MCIRDSTNAAWDAAFPKSPELELDELFDDEIDKSSPLYRVGLFPLLSVVDKAQHAPLVAQYIADSCRTPALFGNGHTEFGSCTQATTRCTNCCWSGDRAITLAWFLMDGGARAMQSICIAPETVTEQRASTIASLGDEMHGFIPRLGYWGAS
eukprot:TRINITY_DN16365_c0_g2_i1.p1 TRINITY_DN16365_c0_g2~~TRINITY_DN16365_c0_g2_i1.p1  ORF type:complete len:153 (-),score=10.54 TRINITY_DN16365_c0_g2_i1:8-466(-)